MAALVIRVFDRTAAVIAALVCLRNIGRVTGGRMFVHMLVRRYRPGCVMMMAGALRRGLRINRRIAVSGSHGKAQPITACDNCNQRPNGDLAEHSKHGFIMRRSNGTSSEVTCG